jgi:hypothetical protein
MEEEFNPSDAVPGESANDVVPSEGSENDSLVGLSLEEINSLTGRTYNDLQAAKAGLQNLASFVGKKVESQVIEKTVTDPEIASKVTTLEKQLQETMFYSQNPDYNNDDFKNMVALSGKSPAELVQTPQFKEQYAKIKAYNEIEKSKSVLQSNSRLGQVTDKFTQAKEAVQSGNQQAANEAAVSAVLEAYPELAPK